MSGAVVSHRSLARMTAAGWSVGARLCQNEDSYGHWVSSAHHPTRALICHHNHRSYDGAVRCAAAVVKAEMAAGRFTF